jgi:hypothetical protein
MVNKNCGADMSRYAVKTRADSPALKKAAIAIEQSAWNPLGFLNFTRSHFEYYNDLLERYADYQICLVDEDTGYPVAVANCVPLAADFGALPPEGWDWIVSPASAATRSARSRSRCRTCTAARASPGA